MYQALYVCDYYDLGHLDDFAAMLPPPFILSKQLNLTVNVNLQEFSNNAQCVTYWQYA